MGMTTTLPASINLAAIGDTESGTGKYIANSGSTVFNFDGSVISVALTVYGQTMAVSPGFDFGTYSSAMNIDNITITAVGNGSTTLEIVSGKPSVTPTVSIPVTVGAVAEDESYLNKRGLTHFWENIDDIKQDKLTAGTNITISANNTISASQPTVGNATLTIQKNGTNVQTFTANATSNKTANITVPTKTSDLTNDSNFATTSQIPTKTSDLTNDSGFVNSTAIAGKQDLLTAGDHINITGTTIKATDYVHSEQPVPTSAVTPVVTGNMISNGTITADKLATGATLKLTLSTSDIGEGSALAANTLYGVYQ